MGSNTPLGNTNNTNGWNLPAPNQPPATNPPLKTPTYQSGFPEIDTFLNTTAQYAANTVKTMGVNLNTTNTPVDTLFKNQSISTQGLFTLIGGGASTTGYNNNVTLGNNISSFAPTVAVAPPTIQQGLMPATTQGNWDNVVTQGANQPNWASTISTDGSVKINANASIPTKAATKSTKEDLTMEQLLKAPPPVADTKAKPVTEAKTEPKEALQTIASILEKSPNKAVAGPTGAVFGRANNSLGLPEAVTQTTNASFLPTGTDVSTVAGLSKEKSVALTMLSNQYPELAKMYLQDTAAKNKALNAEATKAGAEAKTTTTPTDIAGMPSGFNQLYGASVKPEVQLGKADDAQRSETMKLLSEAQKLTSKDVTPKK